VQAQPGGHRHRVHTLISAPTGSARPRRVPLGHRPLAATRCPDDDRHTRLVYVSPLKALSYDIGAQPAPPLRGMRPTSRSDPPATPAARAPGDRRARGHPHHDAGVVYLILTSQARTCSSGQWAIVDEIHAIASTKRGRTPR